MILNLLLSGLLNLFIVGSAVSGFIAESDNIFWGGFLLSIGWIIALLLNIKAFKKCTTIWFIIAYLSVWALPFLNSYVFGLIQDL